MASLRPSTGCGHPVDSSEQAAPNLRNCDALQRVHKQHPGYEIPRAGRQVAGQIVDAALQQAPDRSHAGCGSILRTLMSTAPA
jgi:hypothetical protein